MEWTIAEIQDLHLLLQDHREDGTSVNEIARLIGRTRNSVINAARKLVLHQFMNGHTKAEVVQAYGLRNIRAVIGNDKFYVPIQDDTAFSIPTHAWMVAGLIFAAGIARWGMVLCASPLLHQ